MLLKEQPLTSTSLGFVEALNLMARVVSKATAAWPSRETRRTLVRSFIVLGFCWVVALGSIALQAHFEAEETFQHLVASDDKLTTATIGDNAAVAVRLKQILHESRQRSGAESLERRNYVLIALPVLPVGLFLGWAGILWVIPRLQAQSATL